MDAKQFIASLIGSLAWPGAVVVIALLFRKQIVAILAVPVKRLKAGPVELEFERVLPNVEAKVVEATAPPPPAPTSASGTLPGTAAPAERPPSELEPEREPPELFAFRQRLRESGSTPDGWLQLWMDRSSPAAPVRDELAGVAATQPGAAVLAAHARLTRVLRLMVGFFDPDRAKKLSAPMLAAVLVKRGLLTAPIADAVGELTKLRNLVAHDARADLTPAVALDYLDGIDSVISAIAATLPPKDNPDER